MGKSEAKVRLGILGGTFDPVHLWHLELAEAAKKALNLDRVLFIPAFIPPHKEPRGITDPKLRLEMLNLAIAGRSGFDISTVELQQKEVAYSVDTVGQIKKNYPDAELYFIVGSDAIPELKTWKRIEELFKICNFVIARRPGYSCAESAFIPKSIVLTVDLPDISSRVIRQKLKNRESVAGLIPESVFAFITRYKLYRE